MKGVAASVQTSDQVSGGNKVGFRYAVDEGGALGAVTGHHIIRVGRCPFCTDSADGEDIRIVSGCGNGAVALGVERQIAPVVAGRNDDDDARLPGLLDCLAEWIELIALKNGTAKRKINDSNVICGFKTNRALDRLNYRCIGALAVVIKNLEVDQVHVWRDAVERAIEVVARRRCAVAADQTGDMGTVTVVVVGVIAGVRDEVLAVEYASVRPRRLLDAREGLKIMRVGYAAIDHGHANARANVTPRPYSWSIDGLRSVLSAGCNGSVGIPVAAVTSERAVRGDVANIYVRLEIAERGCGQ